MLRSTTVHRLNVQIPLCFASLMHRSCRTSRDRYPGADPKQIALQFSGARPMLGPDGDLVLTLDGAPLTFRKPVVYQTIAGKKKMIAGNYKLSGDRVQFALGKYELTQREWKACVAAGACSDKPRVAAGDDRFPMMDLSWDDAALYVQWLRGVTGKPYRLPSEAEWEYAARAGATTPYPWGKEIGVARANCRGCGGNYDPKLPAAVGSFPPNPWGLHDMLGGVAQPRKDVRVCQRRGAQQLQRSLVGA